MPMPKSIIKKVSRHATHDKAQVRLTFGDRNNRLYDDIANEEYNEQPEGLVEEETSPFPDILAEIPGTGY